MLLEGSLFIILKEMGV